MTLSVFDIERYAKEDGPGIRTVVFLKGCGLRCSWCQNPESQVRRPQAMHYRHLCVACGRCEKACPSGAISFAKNGGYAADQDLCTGCGACVDSCFVGARKLAGREMSVEEIMAEVGKDRGFFEDSGGGVTVSGGEPLLQPEGTAELLKACRVSGIGTAIETAGNVPFAAFEAVLPYLELLYFDLKHADPGRHKEGTGAGLELIMDNIRRVGERFPNTVARIPIIPGFNDTAAEVRRIYAFLSGRTRVRKVELLPFHRLGAAKYEALGRAYRMAEIGNLSLDFCAPLAALGAEYGLEARAGASGA